MIKKTNIESIFEKIKKAVEEKKVLVEVDQVWADDWWKNVENLKVSFLGAHMLLVAMWAPSIIGVILLVNGKLLWAFLAFLFSIIIARLEKYRRWQEFRTHVMSNPKSFDRFYSLGAITLKSVRTGKTISFPQKSKEILDEL